MCLQCWVLSRCNKYIFQRNKKAKPEEKYSLRLPANPSEEYSWGVSQIPTNKQSPQETLYSKSVATKNLWYVYVHTCKHAPDTIICTLWTLRMYTLCFFFTLVPLFPVCHSDLWYKTRLKLAHFKTYLHVHTRTHSHSLCLDFTSGTSCHGRVRNGRSPCETSACRSTAFPKTNISPRQVFT